MKKSKPLSFLGVGEPQPAPAAKSRFEDVAGATRPAGKSRGHVDKPILAGHAPAVDAWVEADAEEDSWATAKKEAGAALASAVRGAVRERLEAGQLVKSYVLPGTAANVRATLADFARSRGIENREAFERAGIVGALGLFAVGLEASSAGKLLDCVQETAKSGGSAADALRAARAAGIVREVLVPAKGLLGRVAAVMAQLSPVDRTALAERACEWVDAPRLSQKDFDPEA